MFRGKRIISGIMLVLMLVSFIGCKKTSKAATFTYEENAAGNIVITGLTDKGRADAKVIVPAKIDGKKVDVINPYSKSDDDEKDRYEAFEKDNGVVKVIISRTRERDIHYMV